MDHLVQSSLARIPQFIKEDTPGFVDFMSAYYEWLTDEHLYNRDTHAHDKRILNLRTSLDVDSTPDNFLNNFNNQYLFVLPPDIVADKRKFAFFR